MHRIQLLPVLTEQGLRPLAFQDGSRPFVAAFAAANLGDVSPNPQGAFCLDTGLPCEVKSRPVRKCSDASALLYVPAATATRAFACLSLTLQVECNTHV
jgi:hypothetical protein